MEGYTVHDVMGGSGLGRGIGLAILGYLPKDN